jgi:hypothetical protein
MSFEARSFSDMTVSMQIERSGRSRSSDPELA